MNQRITFPKIQINGDWKDDKGCEIQSYDRNSHSLERSGFLKGLAKVLQISSASTENEISGDRKRSA